MTWPAATLCAPRPKYSVGQYLIIYSGRDEGCCFTVRGIRWAPETAHQPARWQYDAGLHGWLDEGTICPEGHAELYP